jgi:competence ComEA-like helix-hairpin-helix protein
MNEFFHFSLFERRGIGTLLICLALLFWLPRRWSAPVDLPEEITWQEVPPPDQMSKSTPEQPAKASEEVDSLTFEVFDPNTVTYEALTEMGLPVGLARGWVNYRRAGAHFQYREDVLRLYQMDSLLFTKMESYIDLPPRPTSEAIPPAAVQRSFPDRPPTSIAINQATPLEWAKLRGIGPVLSTRIVAFRDKLGGFSSVEQVAETYGLPDSTFRQIKGKLRMDNPPARLDINVLPAEQLANHPYISWKQARAVASFRTNHGPFSSAADFRVLRIFSAAEHRRLEPYLNFALQSAKKPGKTDSPATVQ